MTAFTFDAEKHEYRLDGRLLAPTTRVLTRMGLLPDHSKTDPFYRERGHAVHEAIRLDFLGQLDEASIDPEHVAPYLKRARGVRDALGLLPYLLECPLYNGTWLAAGTPDFFGRSSSLDGSIVLDWKTGAFEPGHRLQLNAYFRMLLFCLAEPRLGLRDEEGMSAYTARLAVVSLATDPPKVRWFDPSPSEVDTFRAAVAVYNALPRYGGEQ